jgi:hypothetical protein
MESWRSSLGVTVLALVELSLIGPIASERALELDNPDEDQWGVLSRLKKQLAERQIRAEQKVWPGRSDFTYGELIDAWQPDATKCDDEFFKQLDSSRVPTLVEESLANYVWAAEVRRRDFCFSHLEQQIEEKCGSASSASTRKHFESFVKEDDTFSEFDHPNMAIRRLRYLMGAPENADQLEIAKGYVRACEDVVERCASIKPIRANYPTYTSESSSYWPHVKFYDFCRHLVDFDFAHQIDRTVELDSKLAEHFDGRQDQNHDQSLSGPDAATMSIGTAESDLEQEQSFAAEAAVRYAADWAKEREVPIYTEADQAHPEKYVPANLELGLDELKSACWVSLFRARNLLWMQRNGLLGFTHGDIHKPTTERKLRFLKACEHLEELENEEIIEKAGKILSE